MDKIFILTGGKCVVETPGHNHHHLFQQSGNGNGFESSRIDSYSCKRMKGSWEGGHDPSGHVFLMVHSSLYLFLECRQYWPGWGVLVEKLKGIVYSSQQGSIGERIKLIVNDTPHVFLVVLISFWWWMLLMTNIYFHSISEKLVGLIFGYIGVFVVYYVPRFLKKDDFPDVKKDV